MSCECIPQETERPPDIFAVTSWFFTTWNYTVVGVCVYVLFNWIYNFLVVAVVVFPSLLAVRVPCDVVSRMRCISCFSCINEQLYTSSSSASVAAANYAHITRSLDHTNIEPFNSTNTFTNTKCFERYFFFFCLSLCHCLCCSMSARACVYL